MTHFRKMYQLPSWDHQFLSNLFPKQNIFEKTFCIFSLKSFKMAFEQHSSFSCIKYFASKIDQNIKKISSTDLNNSYVRKLSNPYFGNVYQLSENSENMFPKVQVFLIFQEKSLKPTVTVEIILVNANLLVIINAPKVLFLLLYYYTFLHQQYLQRVKLIF